MNGPSLSGAETVLLRGRHIEHVTGITGVEDGACLGWAFVKDEIAVGFIGIVTLNNGTEYASVSLSDGIAFRPSWHRWAVHLIKAFQQSGFERMICTCDETKVNAAGWLLRLGFTEIEAPTGFERMISNGERLFEWAK